MEIETKVISLSDIVYGNDEEFKVAQYIVPGYQRPYEWKETDVTSMLETLLECYNNKDNFVLFGTLQFNKDDNNFFEIIDGHQRIITFSLLLKFLGIENKIKIKNDINVKYDYELENVSNKNCENKYNENYRIIEKYISSYDTEEKRKDLKREEFCEHILNNIKFVAVITSGSTSLENTLKIFKAINTTGLPLDAKDIFKIKYRDYLLKQETNQVEKEKVFERINNAYLKVNQLQYINENDLLGVLKLLIISSQEKSYAENIKCSNNKFFENIFSKTTELGIEQKKLLTIENFEKIAEIIVETNKSISNMDEKFDLERVHYINIFSKELISWSGYDRIKNILYVFVFILTYENDNEVTDKVVNDALSYTSYIWKYCSAYRMFQSKIVNNVLNEIGIKLYSAFNNKNLECFKKLKVGKEIQNNFCNVFSESGNVFENSRKDFILALSYIEDSYNKQTPKDVKNTLFYYKKWVLDVEHIISHSFSENTSIFVNCIGNLMYLEKDINRSFGTHTVKFDTFVEDFNFKTIKDCESKNYNDSKLNSVETFMNCVSNNNTNKESIENIINKRQKEKSDFFKDLYKCILSE